MNNIINLCITTIAVSVTVVILLKLSLGILNTLDKFVQARRFTKMSNEMITKLMSEASMDEMISIIGKLNNIGGKQ